MFEFSTMHLQILHFPIALIIAAAVADVLWVVSRRGVFKAAGYYCVIAGAAMAIPTMATGLMLMDRLEDKGLVAPEEAPSPAAATATSLTAATSAKPAEYQFDSRVGETHEALGITACVLAVIAAAVRIFRRNALNSWWLYAYGAMIVAAGIVVGVAAHFGGVFAFAKHLAQLQ